MDYDGNFLADNQHSNEQTMPPEMCCCNCGANFGEQKWVQDLITHLKPSIGEEVEKALNRVILPYLLSLLPNSVLPPLSSSSLPRQAEPSSSRILLLNFEGTLPDELLTMTKIKDSRKREKKTLKLEVELLDEFGKRVEVGPESCIRIKIDALEGDFNDEGNVDWTEEVYNERIAKPRNTKGALLKGESEITMSKGVASVSHISFTDNSSSRVNKNLRLGAKVVKGLPPGVVVKAVVSKAIRVKERRLKSDQKYDDPSPSDDLWRLVHIRKDGNVYKRAIEAGIKTIKDLLQLYHTYPDEAKQILKVPEANWNEIVENAEACKLTNECYKYCDVASGDGLLLDCAFNIVRVAFKDHISQLFKYEDLDDFQKEQADNLRRSAYKNRFELENTNVPMKQILLEQEFISPSCLQGQEQLPPLPPCGETVVEGLLESPDAGCLVTNQMCGILPTNVQSLAATPAHQVQPVEHVNRHMPALRLDSFQYFGEELEALLLQDPFMEPPFGEPLVSAPQGAERSHVSQVAAQDHVTSKLIAACYVTKAASLFMISVQQDLRAPNKKRKIR